MQLDVYAVSDRKGVIYAQKQGPVPERPEPDGVPRSLRNRRTVRASRVCSALARGLPLPQRKLWQCIRCKQQVSLTAGTLFDNTKLPLTTWFLAIYLLSQSKNGISALDLKRQLGVSYNTAWRLKHKLMQTMRERDDSQPLRGIVEIDDAYLGGETSGGKRGRGAERKTPFVAAAQVSADGRPERLRLSPVAGFRKRALQAWAEQ